MTMAAGFLVIACKPSTPSESTTNTETTTETVATETTAAQTVQIHKYQIKSAIVTFETEIAGMKGKTILYFDNYGSLELEEKYMGDKLDEGDLCDGKMRYTLNYDKKTAFSMGECARGTAYKFDWSEISDADKKDKAKKLPNVTLAGKDCESYSFTSGSITTTFAGWGNILLMQEQKNKYGGSVSRAISIEENAVIPADKFAPPAGFEVKASGI